MTEPAQPEDESYPSACELRLEVEAAAKLHNLMRERALRAEAISAHMKIALAAIELSLQCRWAELQTLAAEARRRVPPVTRCDAEIDWDAIDMQRHDGNLQAALRARIAELEAKVRAHEAQT